MCDCFQFNKLFLLFSSLSDHLCFALFHFASSILSDSFFSELHHSSSSTFESISLRAISWSGDKNVAIFASLPLKGHLPPESVSVVNLETTVVTHLSPADERRRRWGMISLLSTISGSQISQDKVTGCIRQGEEMRWWENEIYFKLLVTPRKRKYSGQVFLLRKEMIEFSPSLYLSLFFLIEDQKWTTKRISSLSKIHLFWCVIYCYSLFPFQARRKNVAWSKMGGSIVSWRWWHTEIQKR